MYKRHTVETAKSHCTDKDYQTSKYMLASSTGLMAGDYEVQFINCMCEQQKGEPKR